MVDNATKKTLAAIPLLKTNAGPRDKENWVKRLKEEYTALIKVGLLRGRNSENNNNNQTFLSMSAITKSKTTIGFAWNRTKKALGLSKIRNIFRLIEFLTLDGLENAGMFTIC